MRTQYIKIYDISFHITVRAKYQLTLVVTDGEVHRVICVEWLFSNDNQSECRIELKHENAASSHGARFPAPCKLDGTTSIGVALQSPWLFVSRSQALRSGLGSRSSASTSTLALWPKLQFQLWPWPWPQLCLWLRLGSSGSGFGFRGSSSGSRILCAARSILNANNMHKLTMTVAPPFGSRPLCSWFAKMN